MNVLARAGLDLTSGLAVALDATATCFDAAEPGICSATNGDEDRYTGAGEPSAPDSDSCSQTIEGVGQFKTRDGFGGFAESERLQIGKVTLFEGHWDDDKGTVPDQWVALFHRLFPSFCAENHIPALSTMSPVEGRDYTTWPPDHFFSLGLLSVADVEAFCRDRSKSMLSVGVGRAYLERFLVEGLGIDKKQIVLADRADDYLPAGYEACVFDMYGAWPDFRGRKFDLVVFPESFFPDEGREALYDRAPDFVEALREDQMRELLRMVDRCLPILEDDGEMRFTFHMVHSSDPRRNHTELLKRSTLPERLSAAIEIEHFEEHIRIRRR